MNEIDELKEQEKTQYEEAPAQAEEGSRAWIPGLILIFLGIIFLADNYFSFEVFDNWWALFILIPAVTNLSRAWRRYQQAGSWTSDARGSLVGGLILTLVAFIFLFELSWGLFWPVILIIIGAGLLLRAG
jgi:hypothetical protein